ncbi:MAG: tannase/feruloyl esterase family alpha/beta hydrolase [Acidisphaera sp.]|nr:tannase/feruloyl esterase family alpha/beta hydrolase [Acidisphaera sp.]
MRPPSLITAALLATTALSARPAAAASCASLASALLPNATITAAQSIPAGSYAAPDGNTYTDLPAFCRVAATLTPTPQSDINVEVWMPLKPGWNGRFVGTGNGGYAGAIVYSELAATLQLGFAVANTDMGTSPATALDGKPLTGERQKQIDFGYRSTHLMTTVGKQIVSAFYNKPAEYSYFTGCSTGGGQALHEAEQFPDDYDGIVGGAPAENRTNVHIEVLWAYYVTHESPQSLIPPALLALVTQSVLAACVTQSGGLPTDPFLTDPRACHWNPNSLACQNGQTTNCLNPQQVQALDLLYDGPRDPRTGKLIYPGINRGSESGTLFDVSADEGITFPSTEPLFDGLFYWVFGPNWNWQTFDFDHDVTAVNRDLGPILNANSVDLSAFQGHGGKFLMYHGWADALVPPQDDIDYFLRLAATLEGNSGSLLVGENRAHSFYRLFMAPGMGHCFTGPGPNIFGGADNPGGPADPQHNVLLALQRWVEEGVAPTRIIATKYVNDTPSQGVAMTRPLCVFPKVPRYKGSGDTTDAANFECAVDDINDNPMAAPQYLKND